MSVSGMIRKRGVSVTVKTRTAEAVDAVGARLDTYGTSTIHTAFVQVSDGSSAVEAGSQRKVAVATVYFEAGTAVTTDDQIVFDSRTFDVFAVRNPDERVDGQSLAYMIVSAREIYG